MLRYPDIPISRTGICCSLNNYYIPPQCPISLDTPVPVSSQNEDYLLILLAQVTHAASVSGGWHCSHDALLGGIPSADIKGVENERSTIHCVFQSNKKQDLRIFQDRQLTLSLLSSIVRLLIGNSTPYKDVMKWKLSVIGYIH